MAGTSGGRPSRPPAVTGGEARTEAGSGGRITFETFDVLGIPVGVVTPHSAFEALVAWAGDDVGRTVSFPDVSNIVQTRRNPELREAHRSAALVSPDGMPLVWLGQWGGRPVHRNCGPDFIDYAMNRSRERGLKHFLFGGKPGVAERLRSRFEDRYPGVEIVGTLTPPFRPLEPREVEEVAATIRASGAHLVWVGISTPRQEILASELRSRIGATLLTVGAAFDFHSGEVQRAPRWMQSTGLEWAYRLVREPRRLWRRYLVMAPQFLWMVATERRPPLRANAAARDRRGV